MPPPDSNGHECQTIHSPSGDSAALDGENEYLRTILIRRQQDADREVRP